MNRIRFRRAAKSAFTLVEVLVSSVLIVAIMVLLLGTVDQTQRLWSRARSKATQFQAARAAFEVMSRRLSQATLNTYWRANDSDTAQNKADLLFRRQSELQFLSGPMERILDAKTTVPNLNGPADKIRENYPTHGVFFNVPLGATEYLDKKVQTAQLREFRGLDSLLTACGYFIEFGEDPNVPDFLQQLEPKLEPSLRYRLMELTVPAEKFNIYARPVDDNRLSDPRIFDESNNFYDGFIETNRQLRSRATFSRPRWMREAFSRVSVSASNSGQHRFRYARVMAENVVAMIVLPKLAVKDRVRTSGQPVPDPDALELAPEYGFDSARVLTGKVEQDPVYNTKLDNRTRDHLLPPIVQITLVAIDAPSAARMNLTEEGDKPGWTNGLFRRGHSEKQVIADLETLEKAIREDTDFRNVNYRIFTTDVIIRGSKWSRDPDVQ